MLIEIALVISAIYLGGMILLSFAMISARYRESVDYRPRVSVIIAARNEEENIRSCLKSITQLTYPKNLLDVIVVDDRSTDSTNSIIRKFTAVDPFITLITSTPSQLRGKVNALQQGIAISRGEIFMFTDADCTVPPSWVENTVKYYADEKIGIVAGFISIRTRDWFDGLQAIDWIVLLSAASGASRLRFPVTAVGNNFSLRRTAYERVGGYEKIPFSVTEDFSLFHAVTSSGLRAIIPLDPDTTIESNACPMWKNLYEQRKRWFVGGRGMNLSRIVAFAFSFLLSLFVLLGPLFVPWPTWLISVAIKFTADYLLAYPALRQLGKRSLTRHWLPFEIYFSAYVSFLPFIALLSPSIVWKERTFSTTSQIAANEKALS